MMSSLIMAVWTVAGLWAAAVASTYSLAVRRGRMGVRRGISRARIALVAGAFGGPLVTVAAGFVSLPRAIAAAPLLVLPALVALRCGLPRLGALARSLYTDPWGPSDPRTRRAAADPLVTAPPVGALAGAVAAVLVLAGGPVAALVGYGLAAAVAATIAWWAPRRRESVTRAGVLRRIVVGAATRPAASSPNTRGAEAA